MSAPKLRAADRAEIKRFVRRRREILGQIDELMSQVENLREELGTIPNVTQLARRYGISPSGVCYLVDHFYVEKHPDDRPVQAGA